MLQQVTPQDALEAIVQLSVYWPELVGILTTLAGLIASYKSGKTRNAREMSYKLESKIRKLLDKTGLFEPTREKVDIEFVNKALESQHGDWQHTHSDGTYFAPSQKDVSKLLTRFKWIAFLPYRYDTFDCEQYARLFKCLLALRYGVSSVAVVTDYKARHAYNVIVTAEGDAVYVEPQEMEVVKPGETLQVGTQNITYMQPDGDGRILV